MPYVNAGLTVMAIIVIWMLLFIFALTGCARASTDIHTIYNDNGGKVYLYDRYAKTALRLGTRIRFVGKCASACTLYLQLPPEQLCVLPGAYFVFHRSYGGTPAENAYVDRHLWRSYPRWVQLWIGMGGLTHANETMPYSYIKRHIQPCDD